MNKPRKYDAVLGGNNPAPSNGAVIGGNLRWSRKTKTLKIQDSRGGDTSLETPLADKEAIELIKNLNNDFAKSLCKQYKEKNSLSEKQWYYVHKIALENHQQEISEGEFDREGLSRIYTYILSFKNKTLEIVNENGNGLKFYRSSSSKDKDSVYVATTNESTPSRAWCGRISLTSEEKSKITCKFYLSYGMPDWAYELLKEFTESPAVVAARYGRITGKCCFCRLPLTDGRSLSAGYGPVCASKYGLDWGKIDALIEEKEILDDSEEESDFEIDPDLYSSDPIK